MKRSRVGGIALAMVLAIGFAVPAGAQSGFSPIEPAIPLPSAANGQATDETARFWFVELASPPQAKGGIRANIASERRAFWTAANEAKLRYTKRFVFERLWNGVSIEIDPAQLDTLKLIEGIKAVYPVATIEAPNPEPAPDLASALAMTGADIAQSELGLTGTGIRVAIMDTGIDYHHPDLGGCFGPDCRVEAGWDFVGDAYNADSQSPNYNPNPEPDPDPDDCGGHGTHVAGIVGANGAVVGVAPEVSFVAYRVFGCEGPTTADIMIAAMERALDDDVDVLNMSIGSAFQWPQYPTAVAANELVDAGVVVVASIGNSGRRGIYSAGAPGLGENVIGVAAFDNTHITLSMFEVGDAPVGYIPMSGSPPPPTSGTAKIVYVGRGCNGDLPLLDDPSGKTALIERGACTFREKAENAIAAGATAVVVHNNVPGHFAGTVSTPPLSVPVVGIDRDSGLFIRGLMPPATMTWTELTGPFPNPTGGLIASFSSYGLAPDLSLKPDIGAPGGSINSTVPLEQGGYASYSGTSMSSPHVAGAVALYLQAHPDTPALAVRGILQNSADPAPWSLNASLPYLDHVHRQGAGLLDIDDAVLATTRIVPGKLALGESEAGPSMHTLTLTNSSRGPITYDISVSAPAIATTGTFAEDIGFWLTDEVLSFSAQSVTVPAGGSATVEVTVTPPTGPDLGLYGGYVVFTSQGDGRSYSVPYAGFIGDYQQIVALTPTGYNFPWLARLEDGTYINQPDGASFTMQAGDIPYFLVHFDHQVQQMEMEIIDAETGEPIRRWFRNAGEYRYLPRNSTSTSFFAFSWDGTRIIRLFGYTFAIPVRSDDYRIRIHVLKANGDPENEAHWEAWTSPVVTIDRPCNRWGWCW